MWGVGMCERRSVLLSIRTGKLPGMIGWKPTDVWSASGHGEEALVWLPDARARSGTQVEQPQRSAGSLPREGATQNTLRHAIQLNALPPRNCAASCRRLSALRLADQRGPPATPIVQRPLERLTNVLECSW